jgi:hypothetical protein
MMKWNGRVGLPKQASLQWCSSKRQERLVVEGYAAERERIKKRRWLLRRREVERAAEAAGSWRERRAYWRRLRKERRAEGET